MTSKEIMIKTYIDNIYKMEEGKNELTSDDYKKIIIYLKQLNYNKEDLQNIFKKLAEDNRFEESKLTEELTSYENEQLINIQKEEKIKKERDLVNEITILNNFVNSSRIYEGSLKQIEYGIKRYAEDSKINRGISSKYFEEIVDSYLLEKGIKSKNLRNKAKDHFEDAKSEDIIEVDTINSKLDVNLFGAAKLEIDTTFKNKLKNTTKRFLAKKGMLTEDKLAETRDYLINRINACTLDIDVFEKEIIENNSTTHTRMFDRINMSKNTKFSEKKIKKWKKQKETYIKELENIEDILSKRDEKGQIENVEKQKEPENTTNKDFDYTKYGDPILDDEMDVDEPNYSKQKSNTTNTSQPAQNQQQPQQPAQNSQTSDQMQKQAIILKRFSEIYYDDSHVYQGTDQYNAFVKKDFENFVSTCKSVLGKEFDEIFLLTLLSTTSYDYLSKENLKGYIGTLKDKIIDTLEEEKNELYIEVETLENQINTLIQEVKENVSQANNPNELSNNSTYEDLNNHRREINLSKLTYKNQLQTQKQEKLERLNNISKNLEQLEPAYNTELRKKLNNDQDVYEGNMAADKIGYQLTPEQIEELNREYERVYGNINAESGSYTMGKDDLIHNDTQIVR